MSFLNQLKAQAGAVQALRNRETQTAEAAIAATETACLRTWRYLGELGAQLNVLCPPAPAFNLDGRTAWPPMKACEFRTDARQQKLGDREVFANVSMGWRIVPQAGAPIEQCVSVNFPIELERVQTRLAAANLAHDRKERRHPDSGALLSIDFDYQTALRATVMVTPAHEAALLDFRLNNVTGFETVRLRYAAAEVDEALLDEFARLLMGEPSRFVDRLRHVA